MSETAVVDPAVATQAGAAAETFRRLGLEDTKAASRPMPGEAGVDTIPDGLAEFDEAEFDDGDDLFGDVDDPLETRKAKKKAEQSSPNAAPTKEGKGRPGAQARTPFEYGQLLESLGLNVDQFKRDLDSTAVKDKIAADVESGIRANIQGTPTFFLNGKQIENPKNYDDFRATLDQAVSAAR